jgi:hypothetical protein
LGEVEYAFFDLLAQLFEACGGSVASEYAFDVSELAQVVQGVFQES